MKPLKVMINGLPGNMATIVAKHVIKDRRLELIPESLTGPEITETEHVVDSTVISLIGPDKRNQAIKKMKEKQVFFISADFTLPSAVKSNALFYCDNSLPFVIGTTGGDRAFLENKVKESSVSAVIAPNMGKQIVGFQAMMEHAAKTFPEMFKDYSLEIRESHQHGKADVSGTAKAMVKYFNELGVSFTGDNIVKERNPEIQKSEWGIPEEHLSGHAWHTYTLVSKDKTVRFEFTHNVNGRDVYAHGTLDAIIYLNKKIESGVKGEVFTMIDVLKGS